ncbi:GAF and ANTAR domain-containing protein [soil metagenome]
MVDQARLTQELTDYARMLVAGYPVTDALHDLVDAATAILETHGAGVTLDSGDRLMFATALPEDISIVEEVQVREQAGPCIEAFRSGQPVLITDIAAEQPPWPALVAAAESAGVVAVAAFPLHLDGMRLGAFDLYDTKPRTWTPDEVRAAEALAALTTAYLAISSRLDRAREMAEQLQRALTSRVIIEQAKGVLAGELEISVDQAFAMLRAHARTNQAPLREVARAVVDLGLRP